MTFSTWLSSRARLTGAAVLATSLLGCPLPEDSPDGGTPPPRGDMDVACTLEYAPVCGSDGRTYGNACAAGVAGVRVLYWGPCGDGGVAGLPCGGDYGDTCPEGYYCDQDGDAADPQFIPPPWDAGPAPSWDAGVIVSDAGPAPHDAAPLPWDGGGAPPPPAPGVCMPIEEPGCPNVDALVCGSNGITYQNRCVAESMGATVIAEGRCPPGGLRTCGGWVGNTCAESEYCYFEPETWCDYADASGVCVTRPEICTREFYPVCGCDGQTYSNPCVAASNGTSVATYGACGGEPGPGEEGATCGGLLGLECNRGLYCYYPADTECGSGDQTGTCSPRPEACYLIWAPVCGCDGTIYGNDCEAAAAGVSLAPSSYCL